MTGEELRIARKLNKMSQSELGDKLGVHRTKVADLEKMAKIPDDYAIKCQEFFGNLTGVKSLLPMNSRADHKGYVPAFDISFEDIEKPFDLEEVEPVRYYDIPKFAGCVSFRVNTESMKEIKPGSEVFARQVRDWESHIEYGKIYGIVCTDGRKYLKKIRKHPEDSKNLFLLKSTHSEYDDMDLPKNAIKALWLVNGWLVQDI